MAERRKALGRGLEALFGEAQKPVPTKEEDKPISTKTKKTASDDENRIQYIDINEIKPNEMQPRQEFEEDAIEELANSIKTHGVIQPVILRPSKNGYEMVAGERRWRAARKAGLKQIPAIIKDLPDEENALIALIENVQRENLNAMEEAKAFKTLMDKYGMTQESLAKNVGKSRPHVANTLRMMKLPEVIQYSIGKGSLSLGHANALGAIKDSSMQIEIAEKVISEGLSVRATEKLCSKIGESKEKPAKKDKVKRKNAEIKAIEEELTSLMGTKVIVNDKGKGGSIELRYFDRAGLNDLIDALRETKNKK